MKKASVRGCFAAALLLVVHGWSVAQPPGATGIGSQTYAARRAALASHLRDGVIVLFGHTEPPGSEAYFRFHQESNFEYLSGYDRPGAVLVIAAKQSPGDAAPASATSGADILFLPQPGKDIFWSGPRLNPADPNAAALTGFATVKPVADLPAELRALAPRFKYLYTLLPDRDGSDETAALARERVAELRAVAPSLEIKDVRTALATLRQIKSPPEVALIRRAIDCTIDGLLAAGRELRPGAAEYQIAALMKYVFERAGCTVTGFDPIVASGPRSVILHYDRNSETMSSGDVVVLDAGAEYADYSADISRTLPVNGHFTPRQREIYDIVLGAQQAAIDAVRPGMRLGGRGPGSLYQIAIDYLNAHGKDSHGQPLGKYFTHGLGHGVGLDVHDDLASPVLQPGMVITIEPGLYLPEENLGVRIEDMVLVTESGGEVLTGRLPRLATEVEAWMAGSR